MTTLYRQKMTDFDPDIPIEQYTQEELSKFAREFGILSSEYRRIRDVKEFLYQVLTEIVITLSDIPLVRFVGEKYGYSSAEGTEINVSEWKPSKFRIPVLMRDNTPQVSFVVVEGLIVKWGTRDYKESAKYGLPVLTEKDGSYDISYARSRIPILEQDPLLLPLLKGELARSYFYRDSYYKIEPAQFAEMITYLEGLNIDTYDYMADIQYENKYLYALISRQFEIALEYPAYFQAFPELRSYLADIKKEANENMGNQGMMRELLERRTNASPAISWFFTPDGYTGAGYRAIDWVYRSEVPLLSEEQGVGSLLQAVCNVVPVSGESYTAATLYDPVGANGAAILGRPREYIRDLGSYSLPEKLAGILQEFNTDGVRAVIAGGFVVTRGDYDFFILDGQPETARELQELIEREYPGIEATISGSVVTMDGRGTPEIQIIVPTNLPTIEHVLDSFDFSHAQVATDGMMYYSTAAFQTFTPAGCTLMVRPVTRVPRIRKIVNNHLLILHLHNTYTIVDESDHEPFQGTEIEPGLFGYAYSSYVESGGEVLFPNIIQQRVMSGEEIAGMRKGRRVYYISINGLGLPYIDPIPEEQYLAEMTVFPKTELVAIREIGSTEGLVFPE